MTNDARSELRKTIASAISSGRAEPLEGHLRLNILLHLFAPLRQMFLPRPARKEHVARGDAIHAHTKGAGLRARFLARLISAALAAL